MHKALYRSYRPQNFEDVVGQEHIIRTLKNQIENNNVGHAYLFQVQEVQVKHQQLKYLQEL